MCPEEVHMEDHQTVEPRATGCGGGEYVVIGKAKTFVSTMAAWHSWDSDLQYISSFYCLSLE